MVENAYDFEIGSFSCQAPQDVSLYKLQGRNLEIFFFLKAKNPFYTQAQWFLYEEY